MTFASATAPHSPEGTEGLSAQPSQAFTPKLDFAIASVRSM
jgi:hypothetical protein